MRILVAGAHGQVGRRLGRLLATRGDVVLGLVRNPAHADDLRSAGVEPVVLDMEQAGLDEVGLALDGPTRSCSVPARVRAAPTTARTAWTGPV